MKRLTKVFAETTHGTKGYEPVNEIVVNTESICNFSEIVTTLGLLEDVLEEFGITSAEDLRNYLKFKTSMAIWEGKLNYKNKIADLEAKLKEAQKPKEIRFNGFVIDCNYDEARKVLQEDVLKMQEEIQELKKQLAEKEKEIEYQENMKILAVDNKNKKAIEQLEKVKELLNTDFENTISWIDPYEDGGYLNSMTYNHNNTIKIIDNQINELKEIK